MRLFKLKQLQGDGILHVLDMITHNRIYLSTCGYMNDINEGLWTQSGPMDKELRKIATRFRGLVDSRRFTCFVESVESHLMWAHYASGFSGVAVEYEFDKGKEDIRKIQYKGQPKLSKSHLLECLEGNSQPQDVGVLLHKDRCWAYENEWRFFGSDANTYLQNKKPISIVFGARESSPHKILQIIARKFDIKVGYLIPEDGMRMTVEYEEEYEEL